ncbi:MAG: SIS domain-containing protein [Acidimicrobiaceae bacterium]|nr:SIS domain-containing protein [Acidimicrobiaceae bacterium]
MSPSPPQSPQPTGFLYPFLDAEEDDLTHLMDDLTASAGAKIAESASLAAVTLERCGPVLASAADSMASRFRSGGRMFTFGNGGSATDADGAAAFFRKPPTGRPLPAASLVEDLAVLTALANDVGFDVTYSRQLIAYARPSDIAVAFSTSGNSANVLAALEEAARRGMLTVGFSGYDGGAMAASASLEHNLIVRSQSVHRIQEVQNVLVMALWSATQEALATSGSNGRMPS